MKEAPYLIRDKRLECWWQGPELNRRHKDFQSSALPTELPRHTKYLMAYLEGFEPPAFWSVARRSIQLSYRYSCFSETFIRYNRFGEIQVENTFYRRCENVFSRILLLSLKLRTVEFFWGRAVNHRLPGRCYHFAVGTRWGLRGMTRRAFACMGAFAAR
jgi:hypothetical protein